MSLRRSQWARWVCIHALVFYGSSSVVAFAQHSDSRDEPRFPKIIFPVDLAGTSFYDRSDKLTITPFSYASQYWARTAVLKALDVYQDTPALPLVRRVYIVGGLSWGREDKGGMAGPDEIFVVARDPLLDARWIRQTIHHEISTFIFDAYRSRFPTAEWLALNPAGFEYTDRLPNSSSEPTLEDGMAGFACDYSRDSFDNDFNTIVENLFEPAGAFPEMLLRCPKVRAKALLALRFYYEIDPAFQERSRVDLPEAREWP